MKTKGMKHQLELLREAMGREYYAYFMEQGTGKTWCGIAEAEALYASGKIDALVIIAPNGVHTNWIKREFPTHFEGEAILRAWRSGMGKRETEKMEELFKPRDVGGIVPLRVLAMNIEAVITVKGNAFLRRFLRATRAMLILDESSRIGKPDAKRTQELLELRHLTAYRRIASGTPVANAPIRIFSQFEFLKPGLLGTSSYRAFVAEYAEILPPTHPLVRNMIERARQSGGEGAARRQALAQIIATDETGAKKWKNLDRLKSLIAPHSFRVLKKDCLDLPPKVYKTHFFDLTPAQRRAYETMKEQHRVELEDGPLAFQALAARMKLQQITSGFVHLPDGSKHYIEGDNPRIDALMDALEDIDGQVIVWARFVEEHHAIRAALSKAEITFVEYRGEIKRDEKERAIDDFQAGRARVFLGQPDAGGIGITLTAAQTAIYFSCDYDSEKRLQSEDRCHRKGTVGTVVYIDLVANETLDEDIAAALQRKEAVSKLVLGDE